MRMIVDAMGGDNAPGEIVKGSVMAAKELGVDITLVGREEDILACLESEGVSSGESGIEIIDAREVITMEDEPSMAVRRKKDSSMAVALNMLKDGKGDAVISAGSTGSLLAGATLVVKRIKGIRRASLAPVIPTSSGGALLIDAGANVDCTPEYLLQFAYMGSFYAKKIMGCHDPRVALLNIGAEESKGGELQKQTFALLTQSSKEKKINFVGNIEARDVFSGDADVIVTDGFSGNILLKSIEGTALFAMGHLKRIFKASLKTKLAALMVKDGIKGLKKIMDAGEVGGTAMLGISRTVIKAHGSSDARAIFNAARQAQNFVKTGVIEEIESNIDNMKVTSEETA